MVHKEKPHSNKHLVHKLKSILPKQNQKQIAPENKIPCMFQTGRKNTRSLKKNKNNFINFIGDKFAMTIR